MKMNASLRGRLTLGAVAAASLAAGLVLASRLNLTAPTRAAADRESTAPAAAATAAAAMAAPPMPGFNFAKVPSVRVECGFLSNPVEDRLLGSPHYQDKVAQGIADEGLGHAGHRGVVPGLDDVALHPIQTLEAVNQA